MQRKGKRARRRPSTRSGRIEKGVRAHSGRTPRSRSSHKTRIRTTLRRGWSVPAALALLLGTIPLLPLLQNVLGLHGNPAPVRSGLIQEDQPAATVWTTGTRESAGQEDVLWRGSADNRLWQAVMNDGWRAPSPLPGVSNVASGPAAAVNAALDQEDVYWTGTDDQLWQDVWAGGWSGPHDLEMASLGSGPGLAVWTSLTRNRPGQQDIFWKGSGDNRLWETVLNDGWRAPSPVPGVSNVASTPAAVVNAALDQEDIYWTGTDSHLWQEVWAGEWSGPHDLGMGSLGSAPTVAVWPNGMRGAPGQEDVFWKGAGDNRLWEAVMNDGWQGPRSVPGVSNVASAPAAQVNGVSDQEEIYWTGTDHRIWMEVWAGSWVGPYKLAEGARPQ